MKWTLISAAIFGVLLAVFGRRSEKLSKYLPKMAA